MAVSSEAVGIIAGVLTTAAFLPQVLRVLRTRSAGDFSWGWVVLMSVGVFLWFIYGLLLGRASLIIANLLTFVSVVVIGGVKWRQVAHGRE